MRLFDILRHRARSLIARGRLDRDLDEELRYHLEREIEDAVAHGANAGEARRSLAGLQQRREECRDARGLNPVDHLAQDLRFAVRQLVRNPGFTFTAILIMVLGVAASVSIFGFVDAALLAPLPYSDSTKLVFVTETTPQIPRAALSYQDYLDWKAQNRVFSSLDVFNGRSYMLRAAEATELVPGTRVSSGFFRTLGVTPALGRDFAPGEDAAGAPLTVVISHAAWQRRFGGRPDIIGQWITLNATPYLVIGVLPPSFHFAPRGNSELWTALQPIGACELRRSCHNLQGIARLTDGVSIEEAGAEMSGIARRLELQYPDSNRDQGAAVLPLSEVLVGNIRPVLLVLLGGAGLLLLIACVNVVSLLLVRSESRRRELAVRSALGASRPRLLRQFVTEGFVLAGLGSVLGVIAGAWAMDLLHGLIPSDMMARMPALASLGVGPRVLGFASAIAIAATLLFAVVPALQIASAGRRAAIAEGPRGSTGHNWQRLGFRLVVVELAVAMVLLSGAGLLGKSFYRLLGVDLGFEPERVATIQVALPPSKYPPHKQILVARQILERAGQLPGAQAVGLTSMLPVSFNGNTDWIRFVGRPYNGEHNESNLRDVSPDYFRAIGARILQGRSFTAADTESSARVVIINQTLARRYFPGENPIGKQIGDTSLTPSSIKEIVGVVDDIKEGALDSELWPAVYYPFDQGPDTSFALAVRTAQPADVVLPSLVAAIAQIDPDIGTTNPISMSERITESPVAYLRRSSAWLIGSFAAIALTLGIVGLYGVTTYAVSQRRREIGVRLAVGAQPADVAAMVLKDAGRVAVEGIGIGLIASVVAASLARTLLFGTVPWDAPTLAAVSGVLVAATLLASYLPARRAASIDPARALASD
jgi:macrolide transport system ATP-binding/permease protein